MDTFAVVAAAPGSVSFQQIASPEPRPEDVVIRLQHSWISNGTESSFLRGERIGGDTARRSGDPLPFPHVPGYQKVGVVISVGDAVRDFREGDVVFATVSRTPGMFFETGGHVSPAVTHQSQVWKVPRGVDPVSISGLVLTQVGWNCGMRAAISPGDRAVVIGDGMVGLWTAQTLRHRGAAVTLLGRHEDRLRLFDPGPDGQAIEVRSTDYGKMIEPGLAVAVDTAGDIEAIHQLLPLIRRSGSIVSAGFYGARGTLDIQHLRGNELSLHSPSGWTRERMDTTLEWVSRGVLQTKPLITHRFPASRAETAYRLILDRTPGVLGVVLDW